MKQARAAAPIPSGGAGVPPAMAHLFAKEFDEATHAPEDQGPSEVALPTAALPVVAQSMTALTMPVLPLSLPAPQKAPIPIVERYEVQGAHGSAPERVLPPSAEAVRVPEVAIPDRVT